MELILGEGMYICGFQKTTLLDYPEHVAATVFLGGCNFRCPFCYNGDLVLHPESMAQFSANEILTYLRKRAGLLQGVCITGGEPTLSAGLPSFLREIKEMGYLVKLDTNGSQPDVLKELCQERLVDYVAMDIKSGLSDYPSAMGLTTENISLSQTAAAVKDSIKTSVHYLINASPAVPFQYEFRTTVVKPLHTAQSFSEIAQLICGADRYFLQSYDSSHPLSAREASVFSAYSRQELEHFAAIVRPHVAHVSLRGVE